MTEAIEKRIADLKRKLAARKGKVPYHDNVPALEAEIAKLEDVLKKAKAGDE